MLYQHFFPPVALQLMSLAVFSCSISVIALLHFNDIVAVAVAVCPVVADELVVCLLLSLCLLLLLCLHCCCCVYTVVAVFTVIAVFAVVADESGG